MAIIEIWWGNSEVANSEGMQVQLGPTGYTLQGGLTRQEPPLTITAHYFVSPARMNFGSTRCVSQPVALFSGTLNVETRGSLLADGDPRTAITHRLRQRVFLAGKQVAQSDIETEIADIKGDNKSKTVTLGPQAFAPAAFSVVAGSELRVDLIVELDPYYHKVRPGSVSYQGLLQLPQWGIIHGVS